jgi:hypothetical protein
MTPEYWLGMMDVNLNSVLNVTHAVLPHMIERRRDGRLALTQAVRRLAAIRALTMLEGALHFSCPRRLAILPARAWIFPEEHPCIEQGCASIGLQDQVLIAKAEAARSFTQ